MLNEAQNAFPVIIPALHPMRNVLEGFRKVHNFNKIWQHLNTSVIHIIQVGAGGTGGYTAVDIMRFIGNLPKDIQKCIFYTIIDGDEFEEKNLGRQLCQEEDIGHNKAETLVENYAAALGCLPGHVVALPEYVTNVNQLTRLSFGVPRTCYNNTDSDGNEVYNYDIANFVRCFDNSGNRESKLYKQNGYPAFYDGKTHPFISIRFKSAYDEFNFAELEEVGDPFPTWNAMDDNSGSRDEHIVPIFIDCVDNNTVRNIINATIESINSCVKDTHELMLNNIISFESSFMDYHGSSSLEFIEACRNNTLKDWKIFLDLMGHVLVTDKNNVINRYVIQENFDYDSYKIIRYDKFIPAIYLISSGNGKYSGQVAWGRYSMAPTYNYLNAYVALQYKDIWPKEDHPGSYMSRDKVIALKEEQLFLPEHVLETDQDDMDYHYPSLYDHAIGSEGLDGIIRPIFKHTEDDQGVDHYYYPDEWKFSGISIGNFIVADPNAINKDLVLTSLQVEYNLQRIQDVDYGIKAFCKVIDKGAHFCSLDYSIDNYSESAENILHDAEIDTRYKDVILANQFTAIQRPFKSTDPKIIPFFDRYHNFTDWVSQFISVPLPYQLYPNLLDVREDEKEEHMSCAERAEQNIQFINANKTASNLVVQYVTNIINGLFALETPGGEEYRMTNIATEFDTYTDTMCNKKLTVSLLKNYPIKCSEASINIAQGKNVRDAWHMYNDMKIPTINEIE